MTSAADIEIWHNAAQDYDNDQLQDAINKFSSMSTISSKIFFNIGSVYLTQQKNADALKSFQDAVKKDGHLAVGFYMSGICYFKESRYGQAIEQFQQTLKCMRGNKLVDYKQLGLKYQLYECEVLMNQAVAHSKQNETDKAKDLLLKAVEVKVEKKHEKISESLQLLQVGKQLELFLPTAPVIFRPAAHAVKNLKKKDYLGQAKVLYTADPKDNTAGFSGLKLLQEARHDVLTDIRKPGRKETLKRIAAPVEAAPSLALGKVLEGKPPPRKPLPQSPEGRSRPRMETWGGKPSKPLPKSPFPEAPKRPPHSPSLRRGPEGSSWDGQKSQNSAFRENSKSPSQGSIVPGAPLTQSRVQPPKKPLPTGPSSSNVEANNNDASMVNIEVQFSFSVNLLCNESTSLKELQSMIHKQSIPDQLDVFYVDGLGRQKKLSAAALDHVLQGSIENAKLICFQP